MSFKKDVSKANPIIVLDVALHCLYDHEQEIRDSDFYGVFNTDMLYTSIGLIDEVLRLLKQKKETNNE